MTASGEYEPATITVPFKILQSDTQFDGGIEVYVNDTLKASPYSLTYGDKLTVKVKPAIAETTNSTIKATGNMAIYVGETSYNFV